MSRGTLTSRVQCRVVGAVIEINMQRCKIGVTPMLGCGSHGGFPCGGDF